MKTSPPRIKAFAAATNLAIAPGFISAVVLAQETTSELVLEEVIVTAI